MKLNEVLICLLISMILLTSCFMSLFSGRKTAERTILKIGSTNEILNTDTIIREKIEDIYIPYWKNSNTECEKYRQDILNISSEKINIVSCSDIKNKFGFTEGFEVKWIFSDREYTTKALFKSRSIVEK